MDAGSRGARDGSQAVTASRRARCASRRDFSAVLVGEMNSARSGGGIAQMLTFYRPSSVASGD